MDRTTVAELIEVLQQVEKPQDTLVCFLETQKEGKMEGSHIVTECELTIDETQTNRYILNIHYTI